MNILNKIENVNKNDHINNEKNEHFEQQQQKKNYTKNMPKGHNL